MYNGSFRFTVTHKARFPGATRVVPAIPGALEGFLHAHELLRTRQTRRDGNRTSRPLTGGLISRDTGEQGA